MRLPRLLLGFLVFSVIMHAAEDAMERFADGLTFSAWQKTFRAKLSGTLDLEAYEIEQPAPGLVFATGHGLFNPRLTLFLDARWGPKLYAFVQTRADRGFDPNSETKRFRMDEYVLRLAPWPDGRLVFDLGKFSGVIGNWVPRHGSWDNPFIGAPLPYENVTPISDGASPVSVRTFVAPSVDEKYEYNPILWGPTYASGAAVRSTRGSLDFAIEVKNTGPASRPESWSLDKTRFDAPAFAGRIAFHPDLRWNFGLSASDSAYLLPEAVPTLPLGRSRRDYRQQLFGHDIAFAWHHLQVWAELFDSRFEVPRIGTVRTQAGYVETKYKLTPQFYGALRVNRQVFSSVDTGAGRIPWAHDIWRVDTAAGYRLTSYAQVKFQVSIEHAATLQRHLNQAVLFTLRF